MIFEHQQKFCTYHDLPPLLIDRRGDRFVHRRDAMQSTATIATIATIATAATAVNTASATATAVTI